MAAAIDLNADVGESYGAWTFGDDAAILESITSANVACGFHGGDPATLRRTCQAAVDGSVSIGAQVSYPDLVGFGRRFLDMSESDLRDAVLYQLGALDAFAQVARSEIAYVKPHGALYHATIEHEPSARAVVAAATEYDFSLAILGAPGSALLTAADAMGLEAVPEAFVDRGYLPTGRLIPRGEPGALITDPEVAAARAVRLARDGEVVAVDGTVLSIDARSLCVHSDTPGAAEMARRVREALGAADVGLYSFAV